MKFLFLFLWLLLLRADPTPKPLEPLQIAEQFVARQGWPDMRGYLAGEVAAQARRQTLGQQIPAGLGRRCELLEQGPSTAVVAVELRDSVGREDFYLHFRKQDELWKLQAVRSLAMTRLGVPMLEVLTTMPPAEVARYNRKHPTANHEFTVQNIKLWMGADANLSRHFRQHRAEFDAARQLLHEQHYLEGDPARGEEAANVDSVVMARLRAIYIIRVSQHDTGCSSCIEFLIGGTSASTVGFLYQPNPAEVPPMTPGRFIVVRPLGEGWYLYKTT